MSEPIVIEQIVKVIDPSNAICGPTYITTFWKTSMSNIEQESARIIHHEDCNDGDPHVSLRSIRVVFSDAKYNYSTSINGTRSSIADYFRHAQLNLSSRPGEDDVQTPIRIEFLPESEGAPTVVCDLFDPPQVEWKILRVIGQYGNSPTNKTIGSVTAPSARDAVNAARDKYHLPWTAKLIAVKAE